MTDMKTLDEYRAYLHDIVRLKLWFITMWQRQHPAEAFRDILRNRVDIFRKTEYYDPARMNGDAPDFDVPGWRTIEEQLEALYAHRESDPAFEDEGLALLHPLLDRYAEANYAASCRPSAMKCGCLTYHHPLPNAPAVIAIHIANVLQPRSIFDDPLYLPCCLRDVMTQSQAEFGVTHLHCGSWLNSHPRWLACFPPEWTDNRGPEIDEIEWHLGFWGQFISGRGTFHKRNAAAFRATGRLPFAYRTADCSFAALRAHLEAEYPEVAKEMQ